MHGFLNAGGLLLWAGWSELEVSFAPVEDGARGFWERCGFVDTGRVEHGEPRYRKEL